MNVRQSVLGQVAVQSGRTISGVDVGVLVRRLILFDRVIVKSLGFKELPFLIRTFGRTGFETLLSSGLLCFNCGITAVIVDLKRNEVRHVPLNHFSFATAQVLELEKKLRQELRCLQSLPGLKNQQRAALEETIWGCIIWEPPQYRQELLDQIDRDFRSNTPALKTALEDTLRTELDVPSLPSAISLEVQETSQRVFRLNNSLAESFGFSPDKAHVLLQRAVTAVTNLNTRLADMQSYSAIVGFADDEAPLLFGKLAGVVAPLNPKIPEDQFERVIEIADVPDFKSAASANFAIPAISTNY
jgi:hypothetical protein